MRILHVVDSWGGGVVTALNQYVQSTPEYEHFLATRTPDGEYVPDGELDRFVGVNYLPHGLVRASAAVRHIAKQVNADVVHAHSSFAGLMVRAGIANRPSRRVVYTPHCFAAERRDISRAARLAFIVAEFALSLNTYKFGACSIHEHRLASRMFAQKGSVYVPNTAPARLAEADEKTTAPQALQPLRIAMLGRVSPQKDPLFFAGVVGGLRSTVPDIQATWIGTGTAALEQHLTDASVSITGWLSSSEAQERLGEADIYVHTAAWEGFPMAILEAHRAGLLIVARDIAALRGDGNEWLGHSPADIVDKVLMLINPDAQIENRTSWSRILESNTPIEQRMRLIELYAPPRNGNGRNIDADGRRQTKSTNATARLRGESVNPA